MRLENIPQFLQKHAVRDLSSNSTTATATRPRNSTSNARMRMVSSRYTSPSMIASGYAEPTS